MDIKEEEWNEYVTFELDELYLFTLCFKVTFLETSLVLGFDEYFADGVPGMVQMYNELKRGRPYDFIEYYPDRIIFETSSIQHDTVLFTIIYRSGNTDNWEIKLSSRMPIKVLLYLFEKFFDDLLHHPDFPYQYPCCGKFDADQQDKADELADSYIEEHHITDNDEQIEIEKKFDRETLTVFSDDDDGEYLYRCFKDMLTNRRVPEGWTILRTSDLTGSGN